jgi:hypothetical protein
MRANKQLHAPSSRQRVALPKKTIPKRDLPPLAPLTVTDHPWGCVYSGSKPQIIGAGILRFETWPIFANDQATFEGYSLIGDKERRVTIEKDYCPTDTQPGEVWVHYREDERDPGPKIDDALENLSALHAQVLQLIAAIRPVPLSHILAIPAANAFPKLDE